MPLGLTTARPNAREKSAKQNAVVIQRKTFNPRRRKKMPDRPQVTSSAGKIGYVDFENQQNTFKRV